MDCAWTVDVEVPDGVPMIEYGPAKDSIPARFVLRAEHVRRPLRMIIDASFNGADRVSAQTVSVTRRDGGSVEPRDHTTLQLGAVMRAGVRAAARHTSATEDSSEMFRIVRLYWQEFVAWGDPRTAVAEQFGLPRSTANWRIRRARDDYALPGHHAGR